ncbi:6-bladed beta-propeller [Candidatus Dojkabacteria bacterium]|nr:6-bladed beta-propeller [Candidatus Dojkabacteria bacterium]
MKLLIFSIILFIEIPELSLAQKVDANLTKDLVIGLREDSTEYIFSHIHKVCTDSHLNMYIGERDKGGIRVFNEDGLFLEEIGRRGQGPGEFIELTDMTIDSSNNIIVLDRRNRRVTTYMISNDSLLSFRFTDSECIDPFYVRKMNEDCYFLYYREENKIQQNHNCDVFHLYDGHFEKVSSFDDNGQLWPSDNSFMTNSIGEHKLKIAIIAENDFLAVPGLYSGEIIRFLRKSAGWESKVYSGFKPKLKSYVILDRDKYLDYENRRYKKALPTNSYSISGPFGAFLIRRLRQTRGIFTLNNGIIVHFSEKHKKGDVFIQMIEFFTKTGEYLGFAQYDERNFRDKNQEIILRDVLWKDKLDRFYLQSECNGIPAVMRMRLDYSLN